MQNNNFPRFITYLTWHGVLLNIKELDEITYLLMMSSIPKEFEGQAPIV